MPQSHGIISGRAGGNSSPSPLLLSPKDMERAILKERMRCDRHKQFFALIVIHINKSPDLGIAKQTRTLAELLHKRLRFTDEKGLLLRGGLGVLLPMTELHRARAVLRWLLEASDREGISIEGDVFTYSGSDEYLDKNVDNASAFDSEAGVSDSVSEDSVSTRANSSVGTLAVEKSSKPVRADNESQVRSVSHSRRSTTSTVATTHFCPRYPAWKRCSDIAGALIGLTLAFPVILAAGVAIKLTSKGPIFFRQMRTGQFGNAFPIFKLRTMVVDAEELKSKLDDLNERDGPAFKMKNDPRVTKVGQILRKTGLDELPQLWNVLVGDMAIVGPRPLPCSEDAKCEIWHRRRLDTKPGLTCIWQISKSRKVTFADWMRMDLRYSSKRSIRSDVSLICKTAMAVVLGRVGH